MSTETLEWLNTQTLIGYTEKRGGNAWHWRAWAQGEESNHYPGAIPIEDVRRRLFSWEPVSVKMAAVIPAELAGTKTTSTIIVPDRQIIVRSDNLQPLGVFKAGYKVHNYDEWLLRNVSTILDDDLQIGSAGLLQNGAQAWVSVEVPENIVTPEGVEFRPVLNAATSCNGTLATQLKRSKNLPVCDNTLAAELHSAGERTKWKHTKNSLGQIATVREALAIVHSMTAEFTAEIKSLCKSKVTPKQWQAVLDALVPLPEEKGRAHTFATRKRDELQGLWTTDPRVAPWKGNAWGVWQAFNTYNQHIIPIKNKTKVHRFERNQGLLLTGLAEQDDAEVLTVIKQVVGVS
jgi:phage/plasmid-like protein (TIGR03299 family)